MKTDKYVTKNRSQNEAKSTKSLTVHRPEMRDVADRKKNNNNSYLFRVITSSNTTLESDNRYLENCSNDEEK